MSTLLAVKNLTVSFKTEQHSWVEAAKDISFTVEKQQTVAIVGESGSGKSVSALAIMGLLPSQSSRIDRSSQIEFEGENLLRLSPQQQRQHCGRDLAMIFQDPMSSLNPVFSVGSQIAEVLHLQHKLSGAKLKARVIELLQEVGISSAESKYHAYPSQLSGGQQQRVMIAIALACEPKLLIADEPTTALDVTIQKQIIVLLKNLCQRRKMSMIFISHDLALVAEVADRVVVMRRGVIREQGDVEQILNAPQDIYTRALLYCRPRIDVRPLHLPVISDFIDTAGQAIAYEPHALSAQRQRGLSGQEPIILEVKHLQKSFYSKAGLWHKTEHIAVNDVSFKLAKGKTLGLVGESGSGKTTIGLLLMRLHQANAGQVLIDGEDILDMTEKQFAQYQTRIQIIFQNPYASLNPRFTVGQIITEPMRVHAIGQNQVQRKKRAIQLLERVGLPASAYELYPHEFSGGQRQRIAIARCLALQPEIIICDESVSALDVSVQAQVLNLLQELQDEFKLSYIFISHDLAVVKYISDQVMVMQHGSIVEIANADELYQHPQHPYTQQLLGAITTVK